MKPTKRVFGATIYRQDRPHPTGRKLWTKKFSGGTAEVDEYDANLVVVGYVNGTYEHIWQEARKLTGAPIIHLKDCQYKFRVGFEEIQ